MGVVLVESFDVDVGADGSTYTLTNDVGSLSSAFIRRTTSTDKSSGGPTGSTANAGPNVAHIGVELTATSTLTWRRPSSTTAKVIGEVWRYTGASGGSHEFIVRGTFAVSVSGASSSVAISGVSNRNKCVPFITGVSINDTSTSNYELATFAAHIDSSTNLVVSRGASGTAATVYVTVVEFTGSAWSVGYGVSNSHDTATETVTLNTDSTGSGGSTFDVGDWSNAFLEANMEGDSTETGLADVMALVYPDSSTTAVKFSVVEADGSARNDGAGYIYAIKNDYLSVTRNSVTDLAEGNGSYGTATWPAGAPTDGSLDALALEWFVSTSGTGTAHARGRLNARITSASGTIQHWVHRSGNTVRARYGVLDLRNLAAIGISSVDGDNEILDGQTGVVISGFGFEATQGTGKVELVENSDYTGTTISQTVTNWGASSITVSVSAGALNNTYCYLYVTNDSGDTTFRRVKVGAPLLDYSEVVKGMNPSRYWKFQNSYTEEIGGADFNNITSGSPVFVTSKLLCRGDTHSHQIDGNTVDQHIEAPDITEINTSTQTKRYMGGWVELDSVQQVLAVIYEEGAQVNNIAFLIGFGNILMAQCADTGDDYAQAYSDFKLTPDRAYHILFKFEASAYDAEFRLYIDGVLQTRTNGNPWTATDLDSHSGNISMGHQPGENLEVGGTDVAFSSPKRCYYAHWANWSGVSLAPADIREKLFEMGAREDVLISSDTTPNMQAAFSAYDDTTRPDAPLAIRVQGPSSGTDLTLVATNMVFDERVSIQVQWVGVGTLTLRNIGSSNIASSSCSSVNGGTIVVENWPTLTIEGLINGCELRIYDDETSPPDFGTELAGVETLSGTTFEYVHNGSTNAILVQMIASGYEEAIISHTLSGSDQTLTIIPIPEKNL